MKKIFFLQILLYFMKIISSFSTQIKDLINNQNYNDNNIKNYIRLLKDSECFESFDDINDIIECISNYNMLKKINSTLKSNISLSEGVSYFKSISNNKLNKSLIRYLKGIENEQFIQIKNNTNSLNESDRNEKYFLFSNKENLFDRLLRLIKLMENRPEDFKEQIKKETYDLLRSLNISDECIDHFGSSFIFNFENYKTIAIQFINKLVIDISTGKNDFLSFDTCLQKSGILAKFEGNNNVSIFHPLYIISMIDDTKNKSSFKNTTLFEKYFFSIGVCLPDVKPNITEVCKKEDYENIVRSILDVTNDMSTASVESIFLRDKDDRFSTWQIIRQMIPFFILIIPLFINIFLIIFKKIIIKSKKAGVIYNRLEKDQLSSEKKEFNEDENNGNEDLEEKICDDESQDEINKNGNGKLAIPLWYKLLKDIYSFENNMKELFNFNLNNRNINNINGLGYTKGLMGLSILLIVLGYTFFILFNLPIKHFGIWNFHDTIASFLFFPILIGLRYSPRIIFSCSGYTLTYKYLSFISREPDYFFLKFSLLESYKYFILILFILFVKYSLYHIDILIGDNSPSWEIFEKMVLKISGTGFKTFIKLISFKLFDIEMDNERLSQDIFDYFWMPLNEIFFFIFGTILISFGYKLKLRIDYIIIILASSLFIGKIIYYYVYYYNSEKIYTTLYYSLFEYGKLMLNPLFNLPYFLIGMYFGLINYTILRGVSQVYMPNNSFEMNDCNNEKPQTNIAKIIENDDTDDDNNVFHTQTQFGFSKTYSQGNNNYKNPFNENQNDDNDQDDNQNLIRKKNSISNFNKIKLFDNLKIISEGDEKDKNDDNIFDLDKYDKNIIPFDKISYNSMNQSSELKEMPFLITPSNIVNFIRKTKKNNYYLIILVILTFIIIIFIFLNFMLVLAISNPDGSDNPQEKEDFMEKVSLEKIISNKFLNFIYLIDIELLVIFVQFGFFYLYMRGQELINGFFNHIYWAFFSKIYFSFSLILSPIILLNFYNSETLIKVNIINIYVYSFINTFLIFIFMIIFYVYMELPLKKLFKFFIRKYHIEYNEDNNQKDENEEDNDDDD